MNVLKGSSIAALGFTLCLLVACGGSGGQDNIIVNQDSGTTAEQPLPESTPSQSEKLSDVGQQAQLKEMQRNRLSQEITSLEGTIAGIENSQRDRFTRHQNVKNQPLSDEAKASMRSDIDRVINSEGERLESLQGQLKQKNAKYNRLRD